jgi:lipoprotein-anchoring transpeptidase ErfK/SrfK
VPLLKKSSSRRRKRGGDFFAMFLLLLVVVGLGWLWWHDKSARKMTVHKPAVAVQPALRPVAKPVVQVAKPVVQPVVKTEPQKVSKPVIMEPASPTDFPRSVRDGLEAQVALARRVISPGAIDGAVGSQTRAAIATFQRSQKLSESAMLDTNTRPWLTLDAPLLTDYIVSTNDLARLQPIGKTWLAKSQQTALDYETILELVAEKAHAYQSLVQKLNPGVDWANVPAGTVLKIPSVNYPEPTEKAAFVVIHLSERFLEAFGAETNLLAHFPCSIAAKMEKRPVGELQVTVIAPNPNYTVNPELFPESTELQVLGRKLVLQPGPNNPVGVAWIGLDRPGYGMHGTPVPELVGRTESHGCFRLANWDAEYLVKLVWVGMPVLVVP